MNDIPKILIAGVGNELRQDDAFGIALAKKIKEGRNLPKHIDVQEFGIGGIHLVQHLSYGYDTLLMLDAVKWGKEPGHISIRELQVKDLDTLSKSERASFLADMHYANPERALMLAQALEVLPKQVFMLGCEAELIDDFQVGMSKTVHDAIETAETFLISWMKTLHPKLDLDDL